MSSRIQANYLGLKLNSPVVVGACSLTRNPEFVREVAVGGAGAIVLPSLYEEQIVQQRLGEGKPVTAPEAAVGSRCVPGEATVRLAEPGATYPAESEKDRQPALDAYLDLIQRVRNVTGIPIIASLNGSTGGHWLSAAQQIAARGASALEVSLEPEARSPETSGDEIEEAMLRSVQTLCDQLTIPVCVKLSPYHTNLAHVAWCILEAGGKGVVCFAHEPIWRIELDQINATPEWSLTSAETVNSTISGILRTRSQGPEISLAASGGISSVTDVIKCIIAGADVCMIASEIYRSGPDVVSFLNEGLLGYLNRHHFENLGQLLAARPAISPVLRSLQADCKCQPHHGLTDQESQLVGRKGDRFGHLSTDSSY